MARGADPPPDTCYVLSFAIIMLNTSLHNHNVRDKPTAERFVTMNRGINEGGDLPEELLRVSRPAMRPSSPCTPPARVPPCPLPPPQVAAPPSPPRVPLTRSVFPSSRPHLCSGASDPALAPKSTAFRGALGAPWGASRGGWWRSA